MSAKIATPGLLKIRYSDVVMWQNFGNCSISMRKVIITSILSEFDLKNCFFDRWSWFWFNNLGLALGTSLKFYTSVAKGLKLKFWVLIPTFVEVTGEKLVGAAFLSPPPSPPPPPPPILSRIKETHFWFITIKEIRG